MIQRAQQEGEEGGVWWSISVCPAILQDIPTCPLLERGIEGGGGEGGGSLGGV